MNDNISTTNAPQATSSAEPSADAIMQLGLSYRASKALLCAVELDLFTVLADGPLDCGTLQRRAGMHERGARDFLDALVALGMLERNGGRYRNTPATDFWLDRNKPHYAGGILELNNSMIYPIFTSLTEALRTGRPHDRIREGEDAFEFVYADAGRLARFAAGMTGASIPVAMALARAFAFDGRRSVVDVGTAEGAALVEIAAAHPHIEGAGFDLPRMRGPFEAYVRRRGLADRLGFCGGDFMHDDLPSADVLVLGQILHDWDLDVKRMLLSKAHAALPRGGALIVYDRIIDDERRVNADGLLMSLSMLVGTRGGFDYTCADGIGWMREAGFGSPRCVPLTTSFSMLVGVKGKA